MPSLFGSALVFMLFAFLQLLQSREPIPSIDSGITHIPEWPSKLSLVGTFSLGMTHLGWVLYGGTEVKGESRMMNLEKKRGGASLNA